MLCTLTASQTIKLEFWGNRHFRCRIRRAVYNRSLEVTKFDRRFQRALLGRYVLRLAKPWYTSLIQLRSAIIATRVQDMHSSRVLTVSDWPDSLFLLSADLRRRHWLALHREEQTVLVDTLHRRHCPTRRGVRLRVDQIYFNAHVMFGQKIPAVVLLERGGFVTNKSNPMEIDTVNMFYLTSNEWQWRTGHGWKGIEETSDRTEDRVARWCNEHDRPDQIYDTSLTSMQRR